LAGMAADSIAIVELAMTRLGKFKLRQCRIITTKLSLISLVQG